MNAPTGRRSIFAWGVRSEPGKTVKVTFSGTENPSLKGLLAIDGGSKASGIAIGMETQGGQPLPLNKAGEGYRLVAGNNTLTVLAYVQGSQRRLPSGE